MSGYACIGERIAISTDWADLATADPWAAIVYAMCWPGCNIYGILPGDARSFRAHVCPLLPLDDARIEEILQLLKQRGFVVRYKAGQRRLLWLRNWHEQNQVRWDRVGPPEDPLPREWAVPPALAGYLETLTKRGEETNLTRYFAERSRQLPDTPGNSRSLPLARRAPAHAGPPPSPSPTSALPPGGNARAESASPIPEPTSRQRDLRAEALAGDGHMLLQNNPQVRELVARCCPHFTGPQAGTWATRLLQAIRDPNTPLSREEWLAAFEDDKPTGASKPDRWVEFHENKARGIRGKRERDAPPEPTMTPGHRPLDLRSLDDDGNPIPGWVAPERIG